MSELSELRKQLLKQELEKLFFDNGIIIQGYDIELYSFNYFKDTEEFKRVASESAEHLVDGDYYDGK